MFKKYVKSALLGLSMLAIGGMANAAIVEINMYGASAEYNYWVSADQNWLTSAGCNELDVMRPALHRMALRSAITSAALIASFPQDLNMPGLPILASAGTRLSCATLPRHPTTASRLFRA